MTGLTLPGIIEDPGCSAGIFNSFNPDIGPLPIHLISLEILKRDEANVFKVPESWTISSREPCLESETGAVELLRVQKERIEDIQEFNFEQYIKQFQINKEILDNSPDDLIVLHPMPINIGIEISEEASLHNKFKYQEQLRLGIASRIASYKFALELI